MKVIICGAGIGGLTAAHELAKQGVEVVVYERNDRVGGLARSTYVNKSGYTYPVEYSWRVYGMGYKNLLRVLNEIPLRKANTGTVEGHSQKSVFHNLVKVCTYIFPRFDRKEVILSPGHTPTGDEWNLTRQDRRAILRKLLFCATMSRARMRALDHIKWKDFCSDLSPEAQKFLVTMWGSVLGMDPSHMSFPVVACIVGVVLGGFTGGAAALHLMTKPTNDGWFDEWQAFLESKGVRFSLQTQVHDLEIQDGKVAGVILEDKQTHTQIRDQADYYVLGLPVESIANIVTHNQTLNVYPTFQNLVPLAQVARQVQLSVQIFLNTKITYPTPEIPILYLPDSPWAIIIEPQDVVWGKSFSSDPQVKAVWSVGICQTDRPGIQIKKPFTHCTPEEIRTEVWAQIKRAYDYSSVRTESGERVSEKQEVLFYMWDSFQYDSNMQRIQIWEPKFSNNAGAFKLQPECLTPISNLLFATAYTKTHRFIYSMESAAEAGTRAANVIFKHTGLEQKTEVYGFRNPMVFLKPLMALDWLLYKLRIPPIFSVFRNPKKLKT